MAGHLYEVRISGGRTHPEWQQFHKNVTRLSTKGGYVGIYSACVLRHHADEQSVHVVCTEDMDNYADVSVEEITRATLEEQHFPWKGLVQSYFLPYGSFPKF